MNVVAHNITALNAQRQFGIVTRRQEKRMEKLSSGYRINRAADDAAGLSISEGMRWMIRGLNQGIRNTQDGISFVQTGDGAMNEIHDILHRMTELSVQAANGTCSEKERAYIDLEISRLKEEINRIGDETKFNDLNVFDNRSVIFGLEGTPKDLEIYDATYDSNNNLTEYGGFVFHGERISWDKISPNMVKIDSKTGKQVFTGGSYSYTSPNTGYSFEFRSQKGAEVPIITREISIAADKDGIILGGERFSWDTDVRDLNGNLLDKNNIQTGPWSVRYYGAVFSFVVPEGTADIEELARNVNSCKTTSAYYSWEADYGFASTAEKAVDVTYKNVTNNIVTQKSADTMSNAAKTAVEFTVRAGDAGIWLETNTGNQLSGSLQTWEDLGIESFSNGTKVPDYSDGVKDICYIYKDPSTNLEYYFFLSDITSKDSVIDGLDGMKLTCALDKTQYTPKLTCNTSGTGLKSVTLKNPGDTLPLSFKEELSEHRQFDTENWSMSTGASYDAVSSVLSFQFAGGYELNTNLGALTVYEPIRDYLNWVEREKTKEVLAGQTVSTVSYADYTGTSDGSVYANMYHAAGGRLEMNCGYDYSGLLPTLTDSVTVAMEASSIKDVEAYRYVQLADGSYRDSAEYLQEKYDLIDASSLSAAEKQVQKNAALNDVYNMQKYTKKVDYSYGGVNAFNKAVVLGWAVDKVLRDVADHLTLSMTSNDYCRIRYITGDENANVAFRPSYKSYMREIPAKPDFYIVHSGQKGDETGIPRFAMNTTAMGIAFANCKTREDALQTLDSTSNALEYVSAKRAYYGALQNRLEHTINSNANVSENTRAAESRIRDADMAKEMMELSVSNILAQVGQTMIAQANQSTQGILSLIAQ